MALHQFSDQLFNGITLGMLYILVALGLNIILGLMGVINFSHGSFFMLGAYMAYTLAPHVGFWPGVVAAALIVGAFGMLFERLLIRPLYGRLPEYTLLLTYGTALIFEQIVRRVWGDDAVRFPELPGYLQGSITVGGSQFPVYKDLFLVVVTVAILAGVWLLLNKTNVGVVIRAGTRDAEMVKALGIDMPLTFTAVFGLGRRPGRPNLCDPARAGVELDHPDVRHRHRRRDRVVLGSDRRRAGDRRAL